MVFLFLQVLSRSTFGRALQDIRSNEHRMLSLGFPVYRYKLASFALAGALAGLAGYLSAMQYGFVNPSCCRGISRQRADADPGWRGQCTAPSSARLCSSPCRKFIRR